MTESLPRSRGFVRRGCARDVLAYIAKEEHRMYGRGATSVRWHKQAKRRAFETDAARLREFGQALEWAAEPVLRGIERKALMQPPFDDEPYNVLGITTCVEVVNFAESFGAWIEREYEIGPGYVPTFPVHDQEAISGTV